MFLAASIQYPTVSEPSSLGYELIKPGFHPTLVSPKRTKSVFSSVVCIFPLLLQYYEAHLANSSRHTDLKEAVSQGKAGEKALLLGAQGGLSNGNKNDALQGKIIIKFDPLESPVEEED